MTWPVAFSSLAGLCVGVAVSLWQSERGTATTMVVYAALAIACAFATA